MRLIKKVSWVGAIAGLAISWASAAMAESAAETAVKEAQKYRGQTITIVWEAGLQALDPLNFSGPKWEELTGIKVKVVEVPTAEMFTKIMQEYRAGTGAYDALNVIPAWMPDLANAGALEVARPLCRQIRLPRRAAEDRADLSRQPDDGRRQDLRLPRRWRRLRPLLPQGHLRRSRRSRTRSRPSSATTSRRPRPGRSSTRSASS